MDSKNLSRRGFLSRSTQTLSGVAIGALPLIAVDAAIRPMQARAFDLAPVYDPAGTVIGHLAPDSVHSVNTVGAYFHTEHGFVSQADLQPMVDPLGSPIAGPLYAPAIVEIGAPSTAIRDYAAFDAPIRERIGHGGMIRTIGCLEDQRAGWWLELEDEGGWAYAGHCAVLPFLLRDSDSIGPRRTLQVGQGDHLLRGVWWHNQFDGRAVDGVIEAPIRVVRDLALIIANDLHRLP